MPRAKSIKTFVKYIETNYDLKELCLLHEYSHTTLKGDAVHRLLLLNIITKTCVMDVSRDLVEYLPTAAYDRQGRVKASGQVWDYLIVACPKLYIKRI